MKFVIRRTFNTCIDFYGFALRNFKIEKIPYISEFRREPIYVIELNSMEDFVALGEAVKKQLVFTPIEYLSLFGDNNFYKQHGLSGEIEIYDNYRE